MSAFLTIEGIDGAGKSTQAERLASHLRRQRLAVIVSREPGGSPLGEDLRTLLLGFADPISPRAEALLLAAARAEHVGSTILPALQAGAVVIVDRFVDSSLAYQGYGLGLGVEAVLAINRFALAAAADPVQDASRSRGDLTQRRQECWPDLTLLLDLPVELAAGRRSQTGERADRVESRGLEYWDRVRRGYLALAGRWPERIRVIPAADTPKRVEAAVWAAVIERWPEWAHPVDDGVDPGGGAK